MAEMKPEDLQKLIAESVAQALAAQPPARKARSGGTKRPVSDEDKTKRRSDLEAKVIATFEAEGFTDIQPRVNVLTYDKWLEQGRRVKKGIKAIKCGSFALFHISQTEPLMAQDGPEPEKTDETVH